MRTAVLLLFGCLLLSAGCKSADELYDEGQERELRGDYEAAAYRYAASLEKRPELQKAHGRLLEAGKVAVGQRLTYIADAEDTGAWVEAAEQHRGLDGLVRRAREVGVPLPLPEGYAEQRRANFDAAVAVLLDEGDAATARGQFEDALDRFESAWRYDPSPDAAALLNDARLDAMAAWAEAEFAAGRFRAAYDRASTALAFAIAGPAPELAAELTALRDEALARGSVRVAPLPLWQTGAAERALPDGFLAALNDELELDYWSRPPLFVLTTEPAAVRRALRDFRAGRSPVSVHEAAEIGRALDAHFAFAGEIDRFDRRVQEREREERTARTHGGDRVTYARVEDEITLSAVVAFDVVDARTRQSVCAREILRSVHGRIMRGEYGGSIRTLDLSRDERRLFDANARADRERELEDELLRVLAEHVAQAAYACVPGI